MRHVRTTDPGRILGQVHVRPENVELGRFLRLCLGRAANPLGRVLGHAILPHPMNHGA